MLFGEKILDYFDDIIKDLHMLISIPSVSKEPEGIYPYGKDSAAAIDAVMKLAENYGLQSKNVGYHAMHAEYGTGEENAMVMAHVDVVPAGEGWDSHPYTLTEKDGKLYGRGIMDDKGPAVIALHCLRALKDAGVVGKRKLRVVLGGSEETGMVDMKHYFASEQKPDIGFSPDGEYGICHCEKGIMTYMASSHNDSELIRSFEAGTVANSVPFKAVCRIVCSAEERRALEAEAPKHKGDYQFEETGDGVLVTAIGTASHASMPEQGLNAAAHLLGLLKSCFGTDRFGSFFQHIDKRIGTELDGCSLGIQMEDEVSGGLTYNLGIIHADENNCELTANIRYPATKDGDAISETIQKVTEADGVSYRLHLDEKPLYVPKDSPMIQLLAKAYEDVTGQPCTIYAMGGGTYAREMFGKGVAFGPGFPDNPDGEAHTANEFAYISNMKRHAVICMEAMYRMFTADEI